MEFAPQPALRNERKLARLEKAANIYDAAYGDAAAMDVNKCNDANESLRNIMALLVSKCLHCRTLHSKTQAISRPYSAVLSIS